METLQTQQPQNLLLQEAVAPMPIFAPRPQTAIDIAPEASADIPFVPNPRQLLMRALFHLIKTPVREMQVLDHHQGAAVVFFLPHGFVSYRELNEGPTLEEMVGEILERLTDVEETQQAILGRLRLIQRQAAARQREEAAGRRASQRPIVNLDPVIPVSIKSLGFRYEAVMRQVAAALIYWQAGFSLQEHQTWGERVIRLLQQADEVLAQNKVLKPGETAFMRHYLDLFVANPALWQPAA